MKQFSLPIEQVDYLYVHSDLRINQGNNLQMYILYLNPKQAFKQCCIETENLCKNLFDVIDEKFQAWFFGSAP